MNPSTLESTEPVQMKRARRAMERNMISPSRFNHEGRTFTLRRATTTPRMSVIWTSTEPKIPPMARSAISVLSGVMSAAAVAVTKISGSEVPMDTMVRPMTTSGNPAR